MKYLEITVFSPSSFHNCFLFIKYLTAITLQPCRWEPFHGNQGPHGHPLAFIVRIADAAWDSPVFVFPEYLPYMVHRLRCIGRRMVMVEFKRLPGPPYDFPAHGTVLSSAVRHDEGLPINTLRHLRCSPHPFYRFLL